MPRSQLHGTRFPLSETQHPWTGSKVNVPLTASVYIPFPRVVTSMAHITMYVPGHPVNVTLDISTLFLSKRPLCMQDEWETAPRPRPAPPLAHPGPATWLINNTAKWIGGNCISLLPTKISFSKPPEASVVFPSRPS